MDRAKILEHNEKQFIKDLKLVRKCVVLAHSTDTYLDVKKIDVAYRAERRNIHYSISYLFYGDETPVMIIL